MRILCLIPVRGGSKGLPRKNALEIKKGVSLLEWTISQVNYVFNHEDIIISSEDVELIDIATKKGARVVERPALLAQDDTTTAAVARHVLESLDPANKIYDAIGIFQVTSALRTQEDIFNSISLLSSGHYDSVISCYELDNIHPAKQYIIDTVDDCQIGVPILPDSHPLQQQHANRHQRSKIYHRNGAIFLVTTQHFMLTGRLWGGRVGIVQMPIERSIDIDTLNELEEARKYIASH